MTGLFEMKTVRTPSKIRRNEIGQRHYLTRPYQFGYSCDSTLRSLLIIWILSKEKQNGNM
jgi:hypothetical protein